jgi:hypothetical protein
MGSIIVSLLTAIGYLAFAIGTLVRFVSRSVVVENHR